MHILKAVKKLPDGSVQSSTYECPHFSIREMAGEWVEIEFPQEAPDGSHPIKSLVLPDDYNAVYQLSPVTGDTMDSWKVKGDKVVRQSREAK